MKKLIRVIGFFILFGSFFLMSFALGMHIGSIGSSSAYDKGYRAGYDYIKSVKELQEQVVAKPDGRWGLETDSKYEKAYCDQCAAIYMTKTGAPYRTAVEGILVHGKKPAGSTRP